MNRCKCGAAVRLGATKIRVNRAAGVAHYITHAIGEGPDCDYIRTGGGVGGWECSALKPYPKTEAEKEYAKLIARWDSA